jgi:lipopolysaccharide transport system ATP-binding protein
MSSNDIVLSVKNVSKCFEMYDKPIHRLFQAFVSKKKTFYKEFWALKDINFEVRKGECIGIIGHNGSGKSTLLQIITGTLAETTGSVEVKGRIAALLELGSGFNPEFNGRENVYMNAAILGLSPKEVDAKYNDIVEFADIGEFIEQPVKSYSSGMLIRLAFSVIAHVDADVLIIDEALGVGDAFFQQKCMRFLREFMEDKTIIFVSHDTAAIINLCDRCIMLEHGVQKREGTAKEVSEYYLESIYESIQGKRVVSKNTDDKQKVVVSKSTKDMRLDFINTTTLRNDIEIFDFNANAKEFGKGHAFITGIKLLDESGSPLLWVVGGENVILQVEFDVTKPIYNVIVGFYVRDSLGQDLFGDNSFMTYVSNFFSCEAGETYAAQFHFRMPVLRVGDYTVTASIAEGTPAEHVQHHWVNDGLMFKSHASSYACGLIGIPMQEIEILQSDS